MDDFYLYLYCGDSLTTHVDNHAGDFIVDLPTTYLLGEGWECALNEITLFTQSDCSNHRLYVCSDQVEESYVRNSRLSVLRCLTVTEDYLDLKF